MMQAIPYAGPHYTGTVEMGTGGITVFAVPSSPDAEPGMAAVTFDPTPDEAEAIAARIQGWAKAAREMELMAQQLALPGLLP